MMAFNGISSSRGSFSGLMLVFGGVTWIVSTILGVGFPYETTSTWGFSTPAGSFGRYTLTRNPYGQFFQDSSQASSSIFSGTWPPQVVEIRESYPLSKSHEIQLVLVGYTALLAGFTLGKQNINLVLCQVLILVGIPIPNFPNPKK